MPHGCNDNTNTEQQRRAHTKVQYQDAIADRQQGQPDECRLEVMHSLQGDLGQA